MKTKNTSTLAALAALIIIATVSVNTTAAVVAVEDNPCAIGVNSILSSMTEIEGIALSIDNPNLIVVTKDEIANIVVVEDIGTSIAEIDIIRVDITRVFDTIEREDIIEI